MIKKVNNLGKNSDVRSTNQNDLFSLISGLISWSINASALSAFSSFSSYNLVKHSARLMLSSIMWPRRMYKTTIPMVVIVATGKPAFVKSHGISIKIAPIG